MGRQLLCRTASSSSIIIIVVSVFIVIRFLFSCNELSARYSSAKKRWIVSLHGERVNSHWRSAGKPSLDVTLWQLKIVTVCGFGGHGKFGVNKLNVGTNKLFPLFEGVHRNKLVIKRVGTVALPFHSTLIAFWFYYIFPFIRFVFNSVMFIKSLFIS